MKTASFLLASGISTSLFAASLSFDDQTRAIPGTFGFSAKGAGFVNNALVFFTKVEGQIFQILPVKKAGGVMVPYNTNVQLQNANSDTVPTYQPYPGGSIGWSKDNLDNYNPTYRFDIFAGGMYYYMPEMSYEMVVEIDGRVIGSKKTNINSNWDPLTLKGVSFGNNSELKVTLKPISLGELPEHNDSQELQYDEAIEQDTVSP
ncbi:hypothetical protein NX722_00175 [Endozoicomonas gorgoniicola]|uniref:Uncharacterized protein n=1 Tax=Endozoicomonas gorgoniicola TaxID=1234144 RepID=A0ABT3MPR2_9GAMM|nr:hypothetical protein [Endozoicomonas gorgoniicola]MCW7551098.1 hypothetical protein [Endozoicomonas gorgoniicola]